VIPPLETRLVRVELAYGQFGLTIDLPDGAMVIRARDVAGVSDEAEALRAAMRGPIASRPLSKLVRRGQRVVVVHSDITRPTPNDRILPVLLSELEAAGVNRGDITLLNALGTHRPQTDAELRTMLGAGIVENYRCLQHDACDDACLVSLGVTSNGHPVRLNRHFLDADVRLLTGFVEPHFFAGFSGGPKGVLPALAGAESVMTNHGTRMIAHPKATWGVTEGNPIWEEMREVALLARPTFLLNVTLNARRQITGVFAGDMLAAHERACEFVRESAMVPVDELFDVVVTTNSGYPLDQNLYQCVKGMSAAERIVRPGGAIIIAAACVDGLPEHGRYAALLREAGTVEGLMQMLEQPGFMEQDLWQVQIQARVQQRAHVYVYSNGLSDQQIEGALLIPCRDIGALVRDLAGRGPAPARIGVLPDGPQTIAGQPGGDESAAQ
jgi:nickel-dependent lactate racemase